MAAILDGSAVYRERYAGCFGGPSGLEDEMEDEEGGGADGQGNGMANEDFGLDEDSDFGETISASTLRRSPDFQSARVAVNL